MGPLTKFRPQNRDVGTSALVKCSFEYVSDTGSEKPTVPRYRQIKSSSILLDLSFSLISEGSDSTQGRDVSERVGLCAGQRYGEATNSSW